MYSLIIVDYNSLAQTIAYIQHCTRFLGATWASHIVVVENGNVEDSFDQLSNAFGMPERCECEVVKKELYIFSYDGRKIVYCDAGDNLGYARGNNLGVKIADALWDNPFYIISNNDLVFEREVDWPIINQVFAENPEIAAIGPKVTLPSGEQQSPRVWQSACRRLIVNYWILALSSIFGKETQKRLWDKYCNDTAKDAAAGFCDWISGCFMIIRAESFRRAGMFDENTFLYAEEMILSKRLSNIGARVYYCPDLVVVHNHAQTTKKFISAMRMMKIDFDANVYFYKKYMNTSAVLLSVCKVSFFFYSFFLKVKHTLKTLLK